MILINLTLTNHGWTATFNGGDMPQGIPLPLPFTSDARRDHVASDLQRRFPTACIQ
jgi:hypothetical protein